MSEEGHNLKVHRVMAGPFDSRDLPDYDGTDFFWVEALIEVDNQVVEMQLIHEDFNELYKIDMYLKGPTIEPYVIGVDSES